MKKSKRHQPQQRHRQRISLKTVYIVGAITIFSMVTGIITFLSLSDVEKSSAAGAIIIIPEQEFVNDKSLPAPVFSAGTANGSKTVLAKKVRKTPASKTVTTPIELLY